MKLTAAEKRSIGLKKAWRDGKFDNADRSRSGRPKGIKDSKPRIYSAKGKAQQRLNGERMRDLMLERGTIGYPKGVPQSISHRRKNSIGVIKAIDEGRLDPADNIRKFIANSDGTENFWQTRVNHGVHGAFYSKKNKKQMHYDSSWELARMRFLETCEEVVAYRREPIQIPYSLNGKAHYYRPDLMVEYRSGRHVIEEIKPEIWLDDPKVKAKIRAARLVCRAIGSEFRIICSLKACQETI